MFELLKAHQLNIMLGMSSVCFVVGLFALITKSLPKQRKLSIVDIEFSAAVLLFSDRLAYIYHGVPGTTGYWMVRISNFLVFFMTVSVVHALNLYLADLCRNEIGLEKIPIRLRIVEIITAFGWLMVIISQFAGLYYTFDENNEYQRGPLFLLCYAIPFLALFIQLSVVFQYVKRLSKYISIPMLLFTILPMVASIIQAFNYGISLTNMTIVGMGVVLYVFAIMEMNDKLEKANKERLDEAQSISRSVTRSFEQTVESFIKAVDQKNRFTSGHSKRVAEYSKKIAQALGMDEKQCFEVYYSAILHDVGKLGLPDSVWGKDGRISEGAEELFKKHAILGGKILSEIEELPFLKTAALYHHERYDGKGYPEGLQGEDIPLIARIVAVADAYDDMTSYKPSRQPLAQGKVRETLINASGRDFDPAIVDVMVNMIDHDIDYNLREHMEEKVEESEKYDITKVSKLHFAEYKETASDGIKIGQNIIKLRFEAHPDPDFDASKAVPAFVIYDSFDRCVHRSDRSIKKFHYFEFGEVWMDGHTVCTSARDIKSEITPGEAHADDTKTEWVAYEAEFVRVLDHINIKISAPVGNINVTLALPDSTRFAFFAITGEHLSLRKIELDETDVAVPNDYIERIAPEISYFARKDGDIPNVQVDAYREEYSQGMPVEDGMRLFFHTLSLPNANAVVHCSYILLYSSDDGEVGGNNYVEYICVRTDGDEATVNGKALNKNLSVHRSENFAGWDTWKEINKRGLEYKVEFERKKNRIAFSTQNAGISIDCTMEVPIGTDNVYVALTGNQVAISNIRVKE